MWILVLTLFSANGHYVKTYESEATCMKEMKVLIKKNESNDNLKAIACVRGS